MDMTNRVVCLFNGSYIVFMIWLIVWSPFPASPFVRGVQCVALATVAVSFSVYLRRYCRIWLLERRIAWNTRKINKAVRLLVKKLVETFGVETTRRFLSGVNEDRDPMGDYFRSLLVVESYRRGTSVHGYFDSGGHFVIQDAGDEIIDESEHPDPDTIDDLDNSWEPES